MDAAPLRELQEYSHLADILGAQGIKCIVVAGEADLDAMTGETLPNLALIDVRGMPGQQRGRMRPQVLPAQAGGHSAGQRRAGRTDRPLAGPRRFLFCFRPGSTS